MIPDGPKKAVIENIQNNIKNNEFNKKVEIDDPNLTDEEIDKAITKFYQNRKKFSFFFKHKIANIIIDHLNNKTNKNLVINGLDNIKDITTGAIITSNHFNPLDSLPIRKVIQKQFHKNVMPVIQDTNLAMPGILGFLMNNLDTIPLSKSPNRIIKTFLPHLKKVLDKKNYVLIYPEEEMWFNYRKPRPCKRGAYQFAAQMNVPVIPCFVETVDTNISENEQFNKIEYIIHILKPIYPDQNKSVKTNSLEMAENDYKQKCAAYEKIYRKKLDYTFSLDDIAGLKKK